MTALRDRILAAAVDRTTGHGWASLTMARLADDVGVSRQTVYNEIGGKDTLAQAIVLDELGRFLALVEAQFDRHPRDPVAGIASAASAVLSRADAHPLLRAIVSLDAGAQTDLLPLLTTDAGSVVEAFGSSLSACLFSGSSICSSPASARESPWRASPVAAL